MYKVDYGKNPQNSSAAQPQAAGDNSNANASGWFPVRATQAPPAQAVTNAPDMQPNGAQGAYPYYPQSGQPHAAAPPTYYPQPQGYQPQGYPPQGYPPQGYQPQATYPSQRGSQPHIQTAARGWQPSVMSVPTYTQQGNMATGSVGMSSRTGGSTKCFRVQLLIHTALHAACAGTFLGIEIWAMYIKAWLANVALGIWAGFGVFIACAIVTLASVCKPNKQGLLNVAFGFSIAGVIVAVGLCAIAAVGISYENNVNYTLRDNFWLYRVPTHIVKLICSVIEIAVCLWELLVLRRRFEPKTEKPRRAPSVSASYHASAAASGPRVAGQPDMLSGFSMPSSVVLSTGPQPAQPPQRAFKELPVAPESVPAPEAPPTYYAPSRPAEPDDDTHTVETSDGEQSDAPAPPPPRPKRGSEQPAPDAPPPRPTRSRAPPPPPADNVYDQPNVPFDDPFSAPITRPAQAGGNPKRFYQYADN